MSAVAKTVGTTSRWFDDRLGASGFMRRSFNKVFPDHWSFMLGEIALYSFIILLLTGTYLTFFFEASQADVVYNGVYAPLKHVTMSAAYASTLDISFEVRAGLIARQIHHWAALLFVAAIVAHLFRVFFTGAFRKPREINWVIGTLLLVCGIFEGFAGYSLPDDLLSGTGIRIMYSIIEAIPIVGSWLAFLIFGGEFPGDEIIKRLFIVHVLLLPGVILGLITAHMMILWHQKHTQFPGPGRTEHNVVGSRLWPKYAANGGAFFMIVVFVLCLLGGLAQINPIWLYGPYDPAQDSAGSQPDWYVGWMDGALRIMPNWEFHFLHHTFSLNIFFPAVIIPGLLFTLLGVYPWIEEKLITKDNHYHNLLERPRDNPTRTAIGAMSIAFYLVLLISGGNDVIAAYFNISLNVMTWAGRIAVIIVPPIAFWATKRFCLALQHSDQELLHHGIETGIIRRLPSGEYIEITEPYVAPAPHALVPAPPDVSEQLPPGAGNGHAGDGHGGTPARAGSGIGAAAARFFTREEEVGPEK